MLPLLGHLCRTNTPTYENVTLLMAFKATISLLGVGWAFCSWAQPLADNASKVLPSRVDASVQRSALWTAVQSLQREPLSESASVLRRLTPDERLQLREQIRRAAAGESQVHQVSEGALTRTTVLHSEQ